MIRLLVATLALVAAHRAAWADPCRDHIAALAASAKSAVAVYWDGKELELLEVDPAAWRYGGLVYYLATKPPKTADLRLPAGIQFDDKAGHDDIKGPCPGPVRAWGYGAGGVPGGVPDARGAGTAGACTKKEAVSINDYVDEYRSPSCKRRFGENSATSIAAEAGQLLGQIVVDRASEAAYALVQRRAKHWLKCGAGEQRLPATCAVLGALRLQDLAMAPDQLRAALAIDALGLINLLKQKALSPRKTALGSGAIQPVFAASGEGAAPAAGTPPARCDEAAAGPRCTVHKLVEDHVVPALARSVSNLTSHPAEAMIRRLVDTGLAQLEGKGQEKLCALAHRERILADVAVAFAACTVNGSDCQIMNVVEQIDRECEASPLGADELGYARSIAGHFWQAVTLEKNVNVPAESKRLVAALEGSFEVACMYASAERGPYRCELQTGKHDETPLEAYESVAIARDIMLAAAMRDGAALGRAFVAAAERMLPAAERKDVARGLRVLATLTAYAATYTGSSPSAEEGHKQRTSLLESLTRDMTNRTERAGDTIASFGGSLRVMGGRRISHTHAGERDTAWTPPLALPLGFAIDYLRDRPDGGGFHMELGILDLGQYLAWDEGGTVATPELTSALSPSLALGYFWGRELPFFAGVTAGYTPSFDFDASDDTDRKGAVNLGVTFGVYVPLLDLN
jgi:hypothetical protein